MCRRPYSITKSQQMYLQFFLFRLYYFNAYTQKQCCYSLPCNSVLDDAENVYLLLMSTVFVFTFFCLYQNRPHIALHKFWVGFNANNKHTHSIYTACIKKTLIEWMHQFAEQRSATKLHNNVCIYKYEWKKEDST